MYATCNKQLLGKVMYVQLPLRLRNTTTNYKKWVVNALIFTFSKLIAFTRKYKIVLNQLKDMYVPF